MERPAYGSKSTPRARPRRVKPDVAIGLGALVVVGLLIAWAMGWIA